MTNKVKETDIKSNYLPFSTGLDLYNKCEIIINLLEHLDSNQKDFFIKNDIRFTPLRFGSIINVGDLTESQKELLSENATLREKEFEIVCNMMGVKKVKI